MATFLPVLSGPEARRGLMPISVRREDVSHLLGNGAQAVEVLPPQEFSQAHLPGAVNIPLEDLDRAGEHGLDLARPVVVYGRDGQCDLSARAAWRLAHMGFSRVFHYAAGKADWLANGLPIEGSRDALVTAGALVQNLAFTCHPTDLLGQVRARLDGGPAEFAVVVNEMHVVLGLLSAHDIEAGEPGQAAEGVMDPAPLTVRCDALPSAILAQMRAEQSEHVLVTTSGGRLVGVLNSAGLQAAARAQDENGRTIHRSSP